MPPTEIVWLFASVIYGLAIGSFLNVVIYRLPRGQSVGEPVWSYCPNCEHRLSGWESIPVLSFLMLGGKCRYCKKPISWRYASVELLTGLLFGLVCLHDGPGFDTVFDCLFIALLIPAFFIDLEHFIIPDEVNVLGFAVGVAHNLYRIWARAVGQWFHPSWSPVAIPGSVGAGVVCALIFHLISFLGLLYYGSKRKDGLGLGQSVKTFWLGVADDYAYLIVKFLGFCLWLPAAKKFVATREQVDAESGSSGSESVDHEKSREEIASEIENDDEQTGMGQGDAKLALMIGANLLLPLSLASFFIALLSGAVIGVIMTRGRGKAAIPFGPFLVVGAIVALLWGGDALISWYVGYSHISIPGYPHL